MPDNSTERLPEESFSRRATQGKGRRSISNGSARPTDVAGRNTGEETGPEESFTRQVTDDYSYGGGGLQTWILVLGAVGVVGAVAGTVVMNKERFFS